MSLDQLVACVVEVHMNEVEELVERFIGDGVEPATILKDGLIKGMNAIGEQYERGDIFLPEMMAAALTMKKGIATLKPHLVEASAMVAGLVVIGTVQGDIHDIGKNLVAMMFEGAGFEVTDVGVDVPAEEFVRVVKEKKPQILGLSALLTNTMPAMKTTICALKESGLRDQLKVLIGGAPVNQEFADEIGADGYATDAAGAVALARQLINP